MISREKYLKFSSEEFAEKLKDHLEDFTANMDTLGVEPTTFPEWHEMLAAWLDVGTKEEHLVYAYHLELKKKSNGENEG